jgi:hypothetical protein
MEGFTTKKVIPGGALFSVKSDGAAAVRFEDAVMDALGLKGHDRVAYWTVTEGDYNFVHFSRCEEGQKRKKGIAVVQPTAKKFLIELQRWHCAPFQGLECDIHILQNGDFRVKLPKGKIKPISSPLFAQAPKPEIKHKRDLRAVDIAFGVIAGTAAPMSARESRELAVRIVGALSEHYRIEQEGGA